MWQKGLGQKEIVTWRDKDLVAKNHRSKGLIDLDTSFHKKCISNRMSTESYDDPFIIFGKKLSEDFFVLYKDIFMKRDAHSVSG